jgi:predicted heme/steroid binding protein
MLELTEQELARHNGIDGARAYIAYEGRIYDVTESWLWRRGRHGAAHHAGTDLTQAMAQAPHGADLLERCPQVGVLVRAPA